MGSKPDRRGEKPPMEPPRDRTRGCADDDGGWGPLPAWWLKEQERKKKKKEEYRKKGLELKRKGQMVAQGGDRVGDSLAKKQKSKHAGAAAAKPPLPPRSEAPGSSKGTLEGPIPVEDAGGPECFKCGRSSHFQNMCTFQPLYVVCSKEGHTSAQCPSRGNPLLLQTMGHAIAGEGFFCLQFSVDEWEESPIQLGANTTVLSMPFGALSKQILEAELQHLFEGEWDWQISPIEGGAFSVVFPDPAMLRMATRSGKLFLSLNNLMVDIRDAVLDAPKGLEMPEVWVKLGGIPPKHRCSERLLAATIMLGRPLLVDEESLIRPGRSACALLVAILASFAGRSKSGSTTKATTSPSSPRSHQSNPRRPPSPLHPLLLMARVRTGRGATATRKETRRRMLAWRTTPSTRRRGKSWASPTSAGRGLVRCSPRWSNLWREGRRRWISPSRTSMAPTWGPSRLLRCGWRRRWNHFSWWSRWAPPYGVRGPEASDSPLALSFPRWSQQQQARRDKTAQEGGGAQGDRGGRAGGGEPGGAGDAAPGGDGAGRACLRSDRAGDVHDGACPEGQALQGGGGWAGGPRAGQCTRQGSQGQLAVASARPASPSSEKSGNLSSGVRWRGARMLINSNMHKIVFAKFMCWLGSQPPLLRREVVLLVCVRASLRAVRSGFEPCNLLCLLRAAFGLRDNSPDYALALAGASVLVFVDQRLCLLRCLVVGFINLKPDVTQCHPWRRRRR
ncbi:hypothetical protein ACQJBY_010938 [Aegilops geniculata]